MPKIVDEAAQRRRIRAAARRAFARLGLAGTGLQHVAAEAGLGRSSLYHYYPDKAALVRDLAEELLDEESALFMRAFAGDSSPVERIERLMAAMVELFDRSAAIGRLMLQIWADDPDRLAPMLESFRGGLALLIEQGQTRGEVDATIAPAATATLIIALMDGVLVQGFVDPRVLADKRELGGALVLAVRRLLQPLPSGKERKPWT